MDPIHVLLADDSQDYRRSLRRFLDREEGLEVVAEAADGRQAVARVDEARPEVVLMDIEMPGVDGIEATREIRSRWPEVQVVALTIYDRPVYREAIAQAGAAGYVTKDDEISELVAAIRKAAGIRESSR